MGNEIFYCTECGSRASGSDFAPGTSGFGSDRSCCPACLGLPVVSRRESTKKIRKPSSPAMVAVAARPRAIEAPPTKRSFVPFIAAAMLTGAAAFALLWTRPAVPDSRELIVASPFPVPSPSPSVREEPPPPLEVKRESPLPPAQPEPAKPELEALADAAYDEIEEAASALADEGRVADALAHIRKFPAEYRSTRAWNHLEGLRRRIEQRAR